MPARILSSSSWRGGRGLGVGVVPGVDLDELGAGLACGHDLRRVGVDEQAGLDVALKQRGQKDLQLALAANAVEPALGGELLAFFGHKAHAVRADGQGDLLHLAGGGHFQVQLGVHGAAQNLHIAVLNVPAVLAQVHDDARGAA